MPSTIIYYFSGTGNSLAVAKQIRDGLADAQVRSMTQGLQNPFDSQYNRVGLVFPVYFGGLPALVAEFINRVPLRKNCYCFAVATSGLWGGDALGQATNILEKRGFSLSYAAGVRMVDNYIFVHSIPSEPRRQSIQLAADEKTRRILADISENRIRPARRFLAAVARPFYRRVIGTAHNTDRRYIVGPQCIGCGLCAQVCPSHNITVDEGGVHFDHRCQRCLACIHWCPRSALNYGTVTVGKERYNNPRIFPQELIGPAGK